jgi:hypothetical protein
VDLIINPHKIMVLGINDEFYFGIIQIKPFRLVGCLQHIVHFLLNEKWPFQKEGFIYIYLNKLF